MKSAFCTMFSGQTRPEGLSEEEWHFKYAYIQNKFDIIKQDQMKCLEMDNSLTKHEQRAMMENVVIDIATKKFERVNKGNDNTLFIDLTCQSTADSRMLVIDNLLQIAMRLRANTVGISEFESTRIVCIQCDKQQVMKTNDKILIKGSVLELV